MKKAIVIGLVLALFFSSLALLPAPARATGSLVQANTMRGWSFPNETVEPLTSAPTHLAVEADENYTIEYTSEGMHITTNENTTLRYIYLYTDTEANAISVHIIVNTIYLDKIKFTLAASDGTVTCAFTSVDVQTQGKIMHIWTPTIDFDTEIITYDFYLALIRDGDNFSLYLDNYELVKYIKSTTATKMALSIRDLSSNSPSDLYISDIHFTNDIISEPAQCWHDTLHSTPVPWGYDFFYTPQIHIDQQTYNMSTVYYDFIDNLGIKASQTIWLHPVKSEDISYTAWRTFLLNEQKKGHEIDVHALEDHTINRTQVIEELEEFKNIFGHYPYGWVDHGVILQDLYKEGMNESSDYYVLDILQSKGMWLWFAIDNYYEHGPSHTLFEQQTKYSKTINSIKTIIFSEFWINPSSFNHTLFLDIALNRDLYIEHTYLIDMLYIKMPNGTKYFINSGIADWYGYTYKEINYTIAKQLEAEGGTWHILPHMEKIYNIMANNYTVYFATIKQIVDYYEKWENLDFDFSASYVNITNNGNTAVKGVTIYTSEEPHYALYCPKTGMYYYPRKSKSVDSWSFVIDNVPKLHKLVLKKVSVKMPSMDIGSVQVQMWGNSEVLYVYAQKDGLVHVEPTFSVSSNTVVKDLTTGKTVSWEKGSIIFTAQAGHTYEIYDAIERATTQIYSIVPTLIGLIVFAFVASLIIDVFKKVQKSFGGKW